VFQKTSLTTLFSPFSHQLSFKNLFPLDRKIKSIAGLFFGMLVLAIIPSWIYFRLITVRNGVSNPNQVAKTQEQAEGKERTPQTSASPVRSPSENSSAQVRCMEEDIQNTVRIEEDMQKMLEDI